MKKLNLNAIRIDGGTQSRVAIDNDAVADYAEAVKAGVEFPPVIVFHDGADHWLADGFHRFHAHKQAGKASLPADIRNGTVRDAILFSLGANGTHGLRRSNADKRKAVQTLLADPEWAEWSDRQIAELCGVSVPFVGAIRRPEVAARQQEHRAANAEKKAAERNPITPQAAKTESPKSAEKRELDPKPENIPEFIEPDELEEARDVLAQVMQENETLRDRLAVEAMDASEYEKTQASETIKDLREQVRVMTIELDAVKASRDGYMRENAELKKQCASQRRELDKLRKAAV